MKNNYYQQTIETIKKLIDKHDFISALKIIEDELAMPYIPLEVEKQLAEFYAVIRSKMTTEVKTLTLEKIITLIENPKLSVLEKIDVVLALDNINLNKHLEEVLPLLLKKEKEIPYFVKARIIEQLIFQRIEQKISFLDNEDNKINLDLKKQQPIFKNEIFMHEIKQIQNNLFQNPLAISFAAHILENLFYLMVYRNKLNELKDAGNLSSIVALIALKQHQEADQLAEKLPYKGQELKEKIEKLLKLIE